MDIQAPKTDDQGFRLRDSRKVSYSVAGIYGSNTPFVSGLTHLRLAIMRASTYARVFPSGHCKITRDVQTLKPDGSVACSTTHEFHVYPNGALELRAHRCARVSRTQPKGFLNWAEKGPKADVRIGQQRAPLAQLYDLSTIALSLGYSDGQREVHAMIKRLECPPTVSEVINDAGAKARRNGNLILAMKLETLAFAAQAQLKDEPVKPHPVRRLLGNLMR